MVFLPDVSSDLEPTEDVDEGDEEEDSCHETVGGV